MNKNKLKETSIQLRKQGKSYRDIQKQLNVAKSTLNYWLKNVSLSNKHKARLHKNWKNALIKARRKASIAHRENRLSRINKINEDVKEFINSINLTNQQLEIFLAGLYLGDGFKTGHRIALGSSNPKILLTFTTLLRKLYNVDNSKLRASIYARADQNEARLKDYWSKLLSIPFSQFNKTQFDQRTRKTKTHQKYKGVCSVVYCSTDLQRRILAISNEMLKYINKLQLRNRGAAG